MNKKLILTSFISLSILIAGCGSNKQAVQPTSNTIDAQTNIKPQTKPQVPKVSTTNTATTPKSTPTTKPPAAKITTTTKNPCNLKYRL